MHSLDSNFALYVVYALQVKLIYCVKSLIKV